MSSVRTQWRRSAMLGLMLFAAVLLLSMIPVVQGLQQRISDTYFRLLASNNQSAPKPVIVLIDDESLELYGRWPWNRDYLAELLRNLDKANAGVMGLDILLSEPQPGDSDAALESAIRQTGRTILVDKIGTYADGPRWNEPLQRFAQAALAVGHAQALLDADGVCRRFPVYEMTLEGRRWALAIEVARRSDPMRTAHFLQVYGLQLQSPNEGALVPAKPIAIPISFRVEDFETISAVRVMKGKDLPDLRRRPVLVGFGPTEIGDRIMTPVSGQIPSPGILVHAQILTDILSGRTLRAMPISVRLLLLLAVSTIGIYVCRRLKGWKLLGVAVAGSIFGYGAGFILFSQGWLAPSGQYMLSFLLAPLLLYSSESAMVERHITRQLTALQVWLSKPEAVEQTGRPVDMAGRLEMLGHLHDRLGSLYELHDALLEATDDGIGVFDSAGNLLLSNETFSLLMGGQHSIGLTLQDVRERIGCGDSDTEGEARIEADLYSYRFVALPITTLSPDGGTIVRLADLRMREQRDQARSEALGFVTHELRTPLVAIQGFSELMMRYPGSPAYAHAPGIIFNESKRLLTLINSYLEMLQVDSGKAIASKPVSLRPVIDQAVAILSPLAIAAEMTISVSYEHSARNVIGDETLIAGAILNLLSNAVKYGRANTEVSVSVSSTHDTVLVRVRNLGQAIPAAERARIFDAYYRASNVSAEQTGWGLGLAFVKRIMDKHGGSVEVLSDQEMGTVFELRFPRVSATAVKAGGIT